MARARDESGSLRYSRREREWLLAALLLSLLFHYGAWKGYEAGNKHGWWQKFHLPAWLQPAAKKYAMQAQFAHLNQPEIFVDVSQADVDAPTRTKYYSNRNSRAANPEIANENTPKITGSQTDVPKTEDVPKPVKAQNAPPKTENVPPPAKLQTVPLQPAMPPPQPRLTPTETPEPPPTPGERKSTRLNSSHRCIS